MGDLWGETGGAAVLFDVPRAGASLSSAVRCSLPASQVRFSALQASPQAPAPEAPHTPRGKMAVSSVAFTPGGLAVSYAPLSWAQWCAVRAGGAAVSEGDAWPAIASLHLVVLSAEGSLLVTRRSQATSFFPGSWSASLEEGLEHQYDVTLADAASRAVAEELACPPPTETVLLAVAREHDPASGAPWGVVFLAAARLDVSAEELLRRRLSARDASEHAEAAVLPVAEALALAPVGGWHPTSPARLALLAEFQARGGFTVAPEGRRQAGVATGDEPHVREGADDGDGGAGKEA